MAAITEAQLAAFIQDAFDTYSDVEVDPREARREQAKKIAAAVAQFVIGRTTIVTGTTATGVAVTGTGVIQI